MSSDDPRHDGPGRAKGLVHESLDVVKRSVGVDDLLQQGSLLAAAAGVSGGLNYAYQVFMGRVLGPEKYGVFGALFAVFYLINVLKSGIHLSASRFTTEFDEHGRELPALQRGFLGRTLLFGCLISGLLILASPAISAFLGVASIWPVIIIALVIPFGFMFTVNQGFLQGLQWFASLAAYDIFQAGAKLIAGVGLVLLGYGVFGALAALGVAMVLGLAVTTVHLRRHLVGHATEQMERTPQRGADDARRRTEFDYGRLYEFVPPAVLAGFCLAVPANIDVIVVKHSFTSAEAGYYNAAAVLGKVLLFLPMGISTALFPKVTADHTNSSPREMGGLLGRALLYSAIIAGTGAFAYWLAPETILDAFYGEAYTPAAPLLKWYGLAIFWFVLAMVVVYFELARDRMRYVYVFSSVSVVEIGLMLTVSDSMMRIIQVIMLVNAALFVYGLVRVKR